MDAIERNGRGLNEIRFCIPRRVTALRRKQNDTGLYSKGKRAEGDKVSEKGDTFYIGD